MMKKVLTYCLWALVCWLPMSVKAQIRPDLVIVSPFSIPSAVTVGSTYSLSAVILNQGTNGSQFNCIGYYLSADNQWDGNDTYLGASCQSLLFPGQSGTCSITATIPPVAISGGAYLILVADPLNAEQESNEANNIIIFRVTVSAASGSALPDLVLWRPSISFSAVPAGGSTGSFTFINNQGTAAVGNYEIGFYLSADTVYSASNDVFLGLATGGGLSINNGTIHSAPVLTVPQNTLPGNYYLVLMADPRNVIAESNENNNSRALPLRVTGNIMAVNNAAAVTRLAIYPNPVTQGLPLTLQVAGNDKQVEAIFYTTLGQPIARQQLAVLDGVARYDTQQLPIGTYLLRVTGQELNKKQWITIK